MTMLDLAVFYDPGNWTRGFWEFGTGYTIVKNRHIGLDIGTNGQAKQVPALLPGPIVSWVDTGNLGRIYIQDVSESGSDFKYLSYCHMSRYNPPQLGISLHQGELFGRLATGPKSVGFGHANYPGSSWTGPHLHLVWHNKVRGAYMLGQNDTYGNPETLIRNVLSTPASTPTPTKPFDPPKPKEWDEMATQAEIEASFRKVLSERTFGGVSIIPVTDGSIRLFSHTTGKNTRITSPTNVRLIERAVKNDGKDTMLAHELNIIGAIFAQIA